MSCPWVWRFQSTPPRGGRHLLKRSDAYEQRVSIHAPAWGATGVSRRVQPQHVVSIHAPAWGATSLASSIAPRVAVSIHAPAWGRHHAVRAKKDGSEGVSIHAPAWGATSPVPERSRNGLQGFNPRPRVGGDCRPGAPGRHCGRTCFNPRPRVGGDWYAIPLKQRPLKFQSTPPRGGRRAYKTVVAGISEVSIHAPAWGATAPRPAGSAADRAVSIHAPAWGATGRRSDRAPWPSVVNPRPRVGATGAVGWDPRPQGFNPRPRVGGDHGIDRATGLNQTVSIHAPAWGATQGKAFSHAQESVSIHAPAWGATYAHMAGADAA